MTQVLNSSDSRQHLNTSIAAAATDMRSSGPQTLSMAPAFSFPPPSSLVQDQGQATRKRSQEQIDIDDAPGGASWKDRRIKKKTVKDGDDDMQWEAADENYDTIIKQIDGSKVEASQGGTGIEKVTEDATSSFQTSSDTQSKQNGIQVKPKASVSDVDIIRNTHPQLVKGILIILKGATQSPLSKEEHARGMELLKKVEEKYNYALKISKNSKNRRIAHPQTPDQYKKMIHGDEEELHPWMPINRFPSRSPPDMPPLVRAWDDMSMVKITDKNVGLRSAGTDWREGGSLKTRDGRKMVIYKHGNHRSRLRTPLISATRSPKELFERRVKHCENRQIKANIVPNTKITLINPNVTLAMGFPVLRMKDEMNHYGVKSAYGDGRTEYTNPFYENEFLLLWIVCPKQIVCTWTWPQVKKQAKANGWTLEQWWQQELMVKFRRHEDARIAGKQLCDDVAACQCCGH